MKIVRNNIFDEKFTSEDNKQKHYIKHVISRKEYDAKNVSDSDYETIADVLQNAPVDNKKIFGYVSNYNNNNYTYVKYNKETNDYVVYTYKNSIPYTISLFKRSWRYYNKRKELEYYADIKDG